MKLHPLIFSHGTLHAVIQLPSETEDEETEWTYLGSTSTLVVRRDASFPKNRRKSALGHPEQSLAGTPYTKQSYSQPKGILSSLLRSSLRARRNSSWYTYRMV
jgi:hypothetical protein